MEGPPIYRSIGLEVDGVEPEQAAIFNQTRSVPSLQDYDEPDFGFSSYGPILPSKSSPGLMSAHFGLKQRAAEDEKIVIGGHWQNLGPEELINNIENLGLSDSGEDTSSDSGLDIGITESQQICVETSPEEQIQNLLYQQDEEGDTRLHLAVVQENTNEFSLILQNTLDQELLDMKNYNGHDALHLAVATNNLKLARMLVICGADVMVQDFRGHTPLHIACEMGNLQMVKTLTVPVMDNEKNPAELKYVPSPQAIPQPGTLLNFEGESCLHLAAKARNQDIIQYLVETCGYDINIKEQKGGNTVFHYAVQCGDLQLLAVLLSCNQVDEYSYNFQRHTALYLANSQLASRDLILRMKPQLGSFMDEELLANITDDEDY